jgi:putative Flp pilus-assembly TadE/G-like protein
MRALLQRIGRQRGDEKRGQILVMFGLGLIVFLGFAALTVDIGFLLLTQRSYQNAADEAALAGAVYLTRPISDPCADDASGTATKHDCAREAAWQFLRSDLDLNLSDAYITANLRGTNTLADGELVPTNGGGQDYRLWVSTPPVDAGTSSSMSTVRDSRQVLFVRVDRVRSPFIAGVLGIGDLNVSSWATAGIFPNRFAVITLRRGRGSTEIDPGPANTTDIKTAGTNSLLRVVNGDVGGNWGMKLNSGSRLILESTGDDEVNAYLIDYLSCGNSCWSSGQVQDELGNTMNPKKLPSFVPDPNYAPPPIPGATWPNGFVDNTAPGLDIPNGDTGTPYSGPPPSLVINEGTVTPSGTCVGPDGTVDTAPRLGPGTYDTVRVRNGKCVILDPVRIFDDPELGLDGDLVNPSPGGNWSWVPNTQYPGMYYITDKLDLDNSSLMVGDGVTVIMHPNSQYIPLAGAAMNINTGRVVTGDQKLGAWTTKAASPYLHDGSRWNYQDALEADLRLNGVGLALYVLKPAQAGTSFGDGTEVIKVNSGAGLSWRGITYAPNDNVAVAGQPNHDGFGQLISWTFTFNGGTEVTQTFDGPGDGFPYLIEPCVLVAGSCQ